MWKKVFLSDLGDLYALVHCTLLDHPLALRPYVILQFPLQIILRPPPSYARWCTLLTAHNEKPQWKWFWKFNLSPDDLAFLCSDMAKEDACEVALQQLGWTDVSNPKYFLLNIEIRNNWRRKIPAIYPWLLPEHEPKEAVPTGHHCLFREDDRGRSSVQWKNSVMHMKMSSIWRVSGVGTFGLQKRTSHPLKSTLSGQCFAINGLHHNEVSFNYVMCQVHLFGRDNFAKTIPAILA